MMDSVAKSQNSMSVQMVSALEQTTSSEGLDNKATRRHSTSFFFGSCSRSGSVS
jgi:hypothetical protein